MSGKDPWLLGRLARAATLVVLLLAACGGQQPPYPSRPPNLTPARHASPAAGVTSTPESGTLAAPATILEYGIVPDSHAALYFTTDGESIVFSGAPPEAHDPLHGPNLYRALPGGEPELIFEGPRTTSDLLPVAAADGYVAFGEENLAEFGEKAWILWLLTPGASEPIELDRNPPDNEAPYPLVAVNERHVVWQHVALGPDVVRADLIEMSLPGLARRVLQTDDPDRYQWWDPSLDGDQLIYTEVDYVNGDPASEFKPAELYAMLLDLGNAASAPRRLDASGMATEPALKGGTVVWKESENVFTWGSLTVHSLASGASRSVPTAPQSGIKTPSVGNRFVAFWGIDATEFYLYDLKADAVVRVYEIEDTALAGAAYRAEVAGDLLAWAQMTEAGGSVIAWGRLPTMDDP